MDLINLFLPKIVHFQLLGYWVLLLVSLLESLAFVGLVFPGSTFVVIMGTLSARGYWDLGDLIWFASVGAILGDGISYVLGKRGKILFTENSRVFKASYLERGEAFFRKHGGKSVFLGRFLGPLRAVIPFVAGISRMDARSFYFWNILSAILWSSSHLLAGYIFGNVWNLVELWAGRAGFLLAVIVLFLICSYLLERFFLTKGTKLAEWTADGVMSLVRRISEIPRVRSVIANHPRILDVLRSRLNTKKFSGLPLTLMGIVFLYILLAFLGVVENIVNRESIVAVDTRFASLLYAYRSENLVKIFFWITLLGKAKILLSLAMVVTVLFWIWNKRVYIFPFWCGLGGSYLVTFLGKIVLHRQRPPEIGVFHEAFYSFPSGHAAIAAYFYGFITYYLMRHIGTWRNRLNFSFAALMLIAAIGFSRLYLGVHFLSDVIGGYLLGGLWLIIGICLTELLAERKPGHQRPSFSPMVLRITTTLVLLISVAFYVYAGTQYQPFKGSSLEKAPPVVVENIVSGFENLHLSKYTESITATEGKPLNVIILTGNDTLLTDALRKAGWQVPDPVTFGSVTRLASTLVQRSNYPAAPIAPIFWNGQANELGFVKPTFTDTPGIRREARFWKTRLSTLDGREIYAGLVSQATGFRLWAIPKTSPDIDKERDELFHDLQMNNLVFSDTDEAFVKPVARKSSGEITYFTDGLICVISLR